MTYSEYSSKVGAIVLQQYDVEDGSNVCFNLLESGEITLATDLDIAAQQVAMRVLQA